MTRAVHTTEVAIVTGGSGGIGRAIAEALARSGRTVVITGRDEGRLLAACAAIGQSTGGTVEGLVADAGDTDAMRGVVARTVDRFGRVDILVNNAGTGSLVGIDQSTDAEITRQFAPNVYGPAAAIGAAWPSMVARRAGCIVNISSWAARDPLPGFLIYSATKSALNAITRSCWSEGKDHGIRAFTIGPGAVETDLLRSTFDASVMPPEACMRPEDVAELVMECVDGRREEALGSCLYIRRDPASGAVVIDQDAASPA
jgi:NAD(P)-dependent dehydrogenase (short-subunit alcohol dehydrogenase family)